MADIALRAAVGEQRFGGPTEHVDEPRRHGQPAGVELALRLGAGQVANGHDLVTADADVALDARGARAVVNRAAANDQVVPLGRFFSGRLGRRGEQGNDGQGEQGGNDESANAKHRSKSPLKGRARSDELPPGPTIAQAAAASDELGRLSVLRIVPGADDRGSPSRSRDPFVPHASGGRR